MKTIFILLVLTIVASSFSFSAVSNNKNLDQVVENFDYGKQNPTTQSDNNYEQLKIQNEMLKNERQNEILKVQIANNLHYTIIMASLYAFSLIIIIILMKMTPDHQAKDLVTIVGLISVIFGSILLVLVVGSTDQLTAPMGILGAIAGYLFGSAQKKEVYKE